jgi:hypothetical protein
MFDWLLPEKHAIAILKKDHDAVKALFDEFEKAEPPAAKEKIIDQAVTALKMHAVLEEEIFYPTVRAHVGNKLMNEADEEHHVAKVLIAELDRGGRKNDLRRKIHCPCGGSGTTRKPDPSEGNRTSFRSSRTADVGPQEELRRMESRQMPARHGREGEQKAIRSGGGGYAKHLVRGWLLRSRCRAVCERP